MVNRISDREIKMLHRKEFLFTIETRYGRSHGLCYQPYSIIPLSEILFRSNDLSKVLTSEIETSFSFGCPQLSNLELSIFQSIAYL